MYLIINKTGAAKGKREFHVRLKLVSTKKRASDRCYCIQLQSSRALRAYDTSKKKKWKKELLLVRWAARVRMECILRARGMRNAN